MIMDKFAEFCDATALSTVGTGKAFIGASIDLGSPARDIGQGQVLYLVITVDTAVTSGGAASVSFELVSDSTSTPSVDGTETLHWKSEAIPKATLVAGYKLVVPLPSVNPPYERYLAVLQDVTTTVLTAGKVNAFLTMDGHGWKSYPEGSS